MEKICVVIDGYSTGKYYSEYLMKAGYKCLHVQSKPDIPDFVKGCFCTSKYTDTIVNTDPEQTIRWIEGHGQPEFIVPGCELGVNLADDLSHHFQTKTQNGIEKSDARRNKFLMTELLKLKGLRGIAQALCATPDEAVAWVVKNNLTYPVVVKPINSTSGDGFHLCRDAGNIRKAFDYNLNRKNLLNIENKSLLVQEFIDGDEYVVDTVSSKGRHVVSDIFKYRKRIGKEGRSVYQSCDFLGLDSGEAGVISEYVKKALDALEIKFGPAHAEVMLDKNGPVLIEVGARLAGCMLDPEFISNAYGHNQVELSILSYTSPETFAEKTKTLNKDIRKFTSLVFLSHQTEGKVTSINFDRFENREGFEKVDSHVEVGQYLEEPKNLSEIPAIIYLQSDRQNQVESLKKDILENPNLYIGIN